LYKLSQSDDRHIKTMDQQHTALLLVQQSNFQNINPHVNEKVLQSLESIYQDAPLISLIVSVSFHKYILFPHQYQFDYVTVCLDNTLTNLHLIHSVVAIDQYKSPLVIHAFYQHIDVIWLTFHLIFLPFDHFSYPQSIQALRKLYPVDLSMINSLAQILFLSL